MVALRIYVLGPILLYRADEQLAVASPRLLSLLGYFLTMPGSFIPADRLVESFWSQLPSEKGANNLQVAISQLRRLLQPELTRASASAYILTEPGGYRWEPNESYLDREAFLASSQQGRRLLESGDAVGARAALVAAYDLYRGPYLANEPYAEWALPARRHLAWAYLDLLASLASCHEKLGEIAEGLRISREGVGLDSTRESLWLQLMRLHWQAGQRSEALSVYEECRRALTERLGVAPGEPIEALRQEISGLATQPVPEVVVQELPLVGREQLLTQLETKWRERVPLVMLVGPAGAGKSRLLDAVATRHDQVLRVNCSQPPSAYKMAADLVGAFLETRPAAASLRGLASHGAALAARLPQLRELWSDCPAPTELPQSQMALRWQDGLRAALALLLRFDYLILIDDWHRADGESRALLGHSLSGPEVNCSIIAAAREATEPVQPPAKSLRPAEEPPNTVFLQLHPLTDLDVLSLLQLVTGTPDCFELAGQMYQITGGHPLYLTEAIRRLQEAGQLRAAGLTDDRDLLAASLRDVILDRIGALPVADQEVLEASAVLAVDTTGSNLAALLDLPTSVILGSAQALAARRLLVQDDSGCWQFTHEQLATTVYEGLPPTGRRRLHRRAAAALAELSPLAAGELACRITRHWQLGAGPAGEIVRWALAAGRWRYEQFDHLGARTYFEMAVTHLDEMVVSPDTRLQIYDYLGRTQHLTGEPAAALESFGNALAVSPTPREQLPLLLRLAKILGRDSGQYEIALTRLAEAEELAASDAYWQGRLASARATILFWQGNHQLGAEVARQAIALAADRQTRREARQALSVHLQKLGQLAEAISLYEDVHQDVTATGDQRHLVQAKINLGNGYSALGKLSAAETTYDEAATIADTLGDKRSLTILFTNRGIIRLFKGNLSGAQADLQTAVALAEEIRAPYTVALAGHHLGAVLALRGQWEPAAETFKDSIYIAEEIAAEVVAAQARVHYGLYYQRPRAQLAEAQLLAQMAVEVGEQHGDNFCRREGRLLMALLALDLGEPAAAEALAVEGLALAQGAGQRLSIGRAERILAQIATANGERAAAEHHFARSELIFRPAGARIELGLTLMNWAASRGQAGLDQASWSDQLVEAQELFHQAGAIPLWLEVDRLTRQLTAG